MNCTTLDTLRTGQGGYIEELSDMGSLARRLADIGFVNGSGVTCVLRGRGIAAYLIGGAVIALRDCAARKIKISVQT